MTGGVLPMNDLKYDTTILKGEFSDMEKNFDPFFDKLKRVGVNTDKTIDRFGGLTELYVKFLDEFADTERFGEIFDSLAKGDHAKAEMCSHKLKGVLGNLGMDALFSEAENVMKELKAGKYGDAEKRLRSMQPEVAEIQRVIKETPHE